MQWIFKLGGREGRLIAAGRRLELRATRKWMRLHRRFLSGAFSEHPSEKVAISVKILQAASIMVTASAAPLPPPAASGGQQRVEPEPGHHFPATLGTVPCDPGNLYLAITRSWLLP
jgi:hypothetical protein